MLKSKTCIKSRGGNMIKAGFHNQGIILFLIQTLSNSNHFSPK